MYHDVTKRITAFHHFKFSCRNHPTLSCNDSDVTHIGEWIVLEAAILFCDTNLGFNGFGFQRGMQSQFDGANRLFFSLRNEALGSQAIT